MYKPRIVEFTLAINGHETTEKVKVDTRKGINGIYPGDEDINSLVPSYSALFLGISIHGQPVYALRDGSVLVDTLGRWKHPNKSFYSIVRHASKKLLKQMKQV